MHDVMISIGIGLAASFAANLTHGKVGSARDSYVVFPVAVLVWLAL